MPAALIRLSRLERGFEVRREALDHRGEGFDFLLAEAAEENAAVGVHGLVDALVERAALVGDVDDALPPVSETLRTRSLFSVRLSSVRDRLFRS